MKLNEMIGELLEVNDMDLLIPEAESDQKKMLKTLMTISRPAKLSDEYYRLEKEYLSKVRENKQLVHIDEIEEELMDNVYIFLGDITTIKADAIVNAANEKLLGCFIPGHHCIDNAIHLSAGLGLRNACNDIMVNQGHDEPVGDAKITKGYNLPSSYVVNTVGPNLNRSNPASMAMVKEQLESCYRSILNAAKEYEDINNIVFCSISTGVYGVPIEIASKVALTTISEYLENADHHLEKVIINVFSRGDYSVYKRTAREIKG